MRFGDVDRRSELARTGQIKKRWLDGSADGTILLDQSRPVKLGLIPRNFTRLMTEISCVEIGMSFQEQNYQTVSLSPSQKPGRPDGFLKRFRLKWRFDTP